MLSKGGKREWCCPTCESPDIIKVLMVWGLVGECNDCDCYFSWRLRINRKPVFDKAENKCYDSNTK